MKVWWWVGYTDRTKAVGTQALGAVVVKHEGPEEAVNAYVNTLGVHPGGEGLYATIAETWGDPPPGFSGRLLGAREAEVLAKRWNPGHGGLAGPDDIREAFLDDEARDGDPLFRGRR